MPAADLAPPSSAIVTTTRAMMSMHLSTCSSEMVSGGLSANWTSPGLEAGLWSTVLVTLLAILAMDLGLFIAHYLF